MIARPCLCAAAASLLSLATAATARAQPQVEIMPGLVVGKPTGEGTDDDYDLGPGLLLAIGARLHPMASLHGQLNVDRPSVDEDVPGIDASVWLFRGQIVPMFHVANERVDFAFGPSLGLFYMRVRAEADTPFGNAELKGGIRGFTMGVQAMLLARLAPGLSGGPLLSFGRLWATKVCLEETGEGEVCDDSPDNDDEGIWNVGLVLRF
jgi:hypothetical protein